MPGKLEPLVSDRLVVNPDGTPTLYFIRWAQQRQLDISEGISLSEAETLFENHSIMAGTGLGGGGMLSTDPTLYIDDTPVAPGEYGDATHSARITVDQQGRITAANEVLITSGGGGGGLLTGVKNSVDQNLTALSFTTLIFDSVLYDQSGCYNPVQPDRITIPSGYSLMRLGTNLSSTYSNSGLRFLAVTKNGAGANDSVGRIFRSSISGLEFSQTVNRETPWFTVTPGDYFQVSYYTDIAGIAVLGGSNYSDQPLPMLYCELK